ncbi:SMI1/KNR4 family protein [Acinetobacter bereziniae]|uniref:SMI1/KNR4 family protein n=1 Tax=Acinetobacter bereziniae TaxID=106648 RepID=UPI00208F8802|nr:SMI1/KNR4 family protein [Acinetobacter bereziniae]
MKEILKLLSISSRALNSNLFDIENVKIKSLNNELKKMLSIKNGFYAFESALHVFPATTSDMEIDIFEWNDIDLWKKEYDQNLSNVIFFAEDIFGVQFCLKDNKIFTFDPETGDYEYLADSLEEWAEKILLDYDILTGASLAHEWQVLHGNIPNGMRLLPKKPFVLGGDYTLENMYLEDSIKGMKYRACIANQIKNLHDGTEIRINIQE